MRPRWRLPVILTILALTVTLATPWAAADPPEDGPAKWFGDFNLRSYENDQRSVGRVTIQPENEDGSVIRVLRYARPAAEWGEEIDRSETITWVGRGEKVEGEDAYEVTYALWSESRGINEALRALGSIADEDAEEVVATCTYEWRNAGWWRSARGHWELSDGTRSGRDYIYHRQVEKVPLGGELTSAGIDGLYKVYVPDGGTLTVEASAEATLRYPDHSTPLDDVEAGSTITYEVPDDALGWYFVQVEGEGEKTVSTRFLQDGNIAEEIRPWSISTWWQVCDVGSRNLYDGAEGTDATQGEQALVKFDRALGLEGEDSAIHWEMGGDYRTSFDFEYGHYITVTRPSERTAEADWHADLDGDGVIAEGGEEARDEAMARLDLDGDGEVSREEAMENGWTQVFEQYDENEDDAVTDAEISRMFVLRYDEDGDGSLSRDEFVDALEADFADRIEPWVERKADELMNRDEDGDGVLSRAEAVENLGAVDFMDSNDADGDQRDFFDRDNIEVVLADGESVIGNRLEETTDDEGNDVYTLYRGRERDEEAGTWPADEVERVNRGVADGDLDDSYSVGWWGHCNAWALAAIVFREPSEDLTVNGVTLSVDDQKGVLTEFGMGRTRDASFYWQESGGEVDPVRYAAEFHTFMRHWVRNEQQGCMADLDIKDPASSLNYQVWNYPVWGYQAEMREAPGLNDPTVVEVDTQINHASYDGGNGSKSVEYVLHYGRDGEIRSGPDARTSWETRDGYGDDAPRGYIRYLIHPFEFVSRGTSGNPNVTMERLRELFGERLQFNEVTGDGE